MKNFNFKTLIERINEKPSGKISSRDGTFMMLWKITELLEKQNKLLEKVIEKQ